jgi:hypothetical protein
VLRRSNVHPFAADAASRGHRGTAVTSVSSLPTTIRNAAILVSGQETLMLYACWTIRGKSSSKAARRARRTEAGEVDAGAGCDAKASMPTPVAKAEITASDEVRMGTS